MRAADARAAVAAALTFLLLGAPSLTAAQEAPGSQEAAGGVVSREIDVGSRSAELRLEFTDGRALEVELDDGVLRLDGEAAGRFDPGGPLDSAWRALLGEAITLDGAPLARRLRAWSPPRGPEGTEAAAADRLAAALAEVLAPATASPRERATEPRAADPTLLGLLEDRPELLIELGHAVRDLDLDRVRLHVERDVAVAPGEEVDGDLVVVAGDLDVEGRVAGDVAVVRGTLRLLEGGSIGGDVRLLRARLLDRGGAVIGDVREVDDRLEGIGPGEEFGADVRDARRDEDRGERDGPGGLGGMVQTLLLILLISGLGGALALRFAPGELERVTEAASHAPLRAGLVGLAGAFLVFPAWLLGIVGLVVTIVGILAVPFWVVLFPVAVLLAVAFGYLGVARALGEWLAHQDVPRPAWVRSGNPWGTLFAGVSLLMLGTLAAQAVGIFGFLRFASILLSVLGGAVTLAALLVGFGAVLVTRGGRRPGWRGTGRGWDHVFGDEDDLGAWPPPHRRGTTRDDEEDR